LDALDALGLGEDDSLDLDELSMPAIELAQRINPKQGRQLRSFMSKRHQKSTTDCYEALASSHSDFTSNVATAAGQRNLKQEVDVLRERLAGHEKLSLARKLVDDEVNSTARFGKLSALNYLLPHLKDKSDSGEGANEDVGLSSLYLILIAGLRVSHNIDEHHALCHAMETILVSKARSVTQHNIESTLETITILCSSSAPRLPATYAAEIYSGFLSLLRLIMNNHRVKIQGRLHVVVQTLKALLRCLVAPAYSDAPTASSALAHRPSWLHSREHQLDLSHAEAFTRLVTAICDPTTSSVAGFQDHGRPSLHSATKEAKQYAGQHMPNLLAQYLQLELDTSVVMKQGVRDALRPGLYATLQCAGRTGRTWLAESVDSAARALLNELIREWSTFGKWQG
jgi:nucleolar pre-ribosomal-associated protein 2